MKLESSRHIFEKCSTIKFHENPSIESRVVPCGRTDMTKVIVALRDFANGSINCINAWANLCVAVTFEGIDVTWGKRQRKELKFETLRFIFRIPSRR